MVVLKLKHWPLVNSVKVEKVGCPQLVAPSLSSLLTLGAYDSQDAKHIFYLNFEKMGKVDRKSP